MLMHNLQIAFKLIRRKSKIQTAIRKRRYDKRSTTQAFLRGDLIWVQHPAYPINRHITIGILRPR